MLMSEWSAGGERASRCFKLDGEEAATTFDLGGGGRKKDLPSQSSRIQPISDVEKQLKENP